MTNQLESALRACGPHGPLQANGSASYVKIIVIIKSIMKIGLLQLNIFQGKYLDKIIEFVKKSDFQILHFQEVAGGKLNRGGKYNYPTEKQHLNAVHIKGSKKISGTDMFSSLKSKLKYSGIISNEMEIKNDKTSYIGNATYYNSNLLKVLEHHKVYFLPKNLLKDTRFDARKVGRNALALLFETKKGYRFWSINTHMAWGPTPLDEDYKIIQSRVLYNFIGKLTYPIILTGDFNVTPETQTASVFDNLLTNHTKKSGIKNTLNGKIHPAKDLFPPGLAVDYIFTSPNIKSSNFELISEPILSDHYALSLEIAV